MLCFVVDLMDVTRDPKLLDEIWKPLEQPTCNRITNKRGLMSPSVSNYCIRKALCRVNCPNGIILALGHFQHGAFSFRPFVPVVWTKRTKATDFFRVSCLLACLPACLPTLKFRGRTTYSTIMRD
jgi:hypothetical protein